MFAVDADECPTDHPVQLAEERLSQQGNPLLSPECLFNLPSDLPQGPQCDQESPINVCNPSDTQGWRP